MDIKRNQRWRNRKTSILVTVMLVYPKLVAFQNLGGRKLRHRSHEQFVEQFELVG